MVLGFCRAGKHQISQGQLAECFECLVENDLEARENPYSRSPRGPTPPPPKTPPGQQTDIDSPPMSMSKDDFGWNKSWKEKTDLKKTDLKMTDSKKTDLKMTDFTIGWKETEWWKKSNGMMPDKKTDEKK